MDTAKQAEFEERVGFADAVRRWYFCRVNDGDLPRRHHRHWAAEVLGRPLKSLAECTLPELRKLLTALQTIIRRA